MHQPSSLEVKFVGQDVWVYAAMHAFSHAHEENCVKRSMCHRVISALETDSM